MIEGVGSVGVWPNDSAISINAGVFRLFFS